MPEQDGLPFESLDAAIRAHETHRPATFAGLRRLALDLARDRGEVTADDLRERTAYPGDRRIFGTVLAALCREGWLAPGPYVATTVRTSHGRPIRVFTYQGKRLDSGEGAGDLPPPARAALGDENREPHGQAVVGPSYGRG